MRQRSKKRSLRDANARLIAAAPELLEAAQSVIEAYRPALNFGDAPTLETLRAAIAKATGEGCIGAPKDCGGDLERCTDGKIRCDAHADSFESGTGY